LGKAEELILPGVHYFQVVFTLPDKLSPLILGNRRTLYSLLFHVAWRALRKTLQATGQQRPAALMMLHTWNQRLEHHPHLHAIVPGGGPSLDGSRWITSRHPTQPRRKKPYLCDNVALGRLFRETYVKCLRGLIVRGKLRLQGVWSELREPDQLNAWLDDLKTTDWNVFIQGPPNESSDPKDALRYLTRYMTGGPISNARLVKDENGWVTFLARSKDKRAGNPQEEVPLPGAEFVRRWAMHILPKSFTKVRYYGGYHTSQREEFLQTCRKLLPQSPPEVADEPVVAPQSDVEASDPPMPKCPQCETEVVCIRAKPRPSWREVFDCHSYSNCSMVLPVHGIGCHYVPDD
jgi:hypothetical protein